MPSPSPAADAPVFVLAAGWRSGSTLVQRILCTDPSLLLWGEPLGRLALIPRIAAALCAITRQWPPEEYWLRERPSAGALAATWIANLFPRGSDLREGLRALVRTWLAETAGAHGFARWGLKEVRYGAAEAGLLAWLFPAARFLVLVRDPRDAYRSLSRAFPGGVAWGMYARWPELPVEGAASFARHWNALATSWLAPPRGVCFRLVRYEDLLARRVDFRDLETFLGLRLDEERALALRLGGTEDRGRLAWHERQIIAREARSGMAAFGY